LCVLNTLKTNKSSQWSIFGAHFFIFVYRVELNWLFALGANIMVQLSLMPGGGYGAHPELCGNPQKGGGYLDV
jgi:hypothetical protein